MMEVVVTTFSYKTCKAAVKLSAPTPNFLQSGCPFCCSTNNVEAVPFSERPQRMVILNYHSITTMVVIIVSFPHFHSLLSVPVVKPQDFLMRQHTISCMLWRIRPSVCPMLVLSERMGISSLFWWSGMGSILVLWAPQPLQNSEGNHSVRR